MYIIEFLKFKNLLEVKNKSPKFRSVYLEFEKTKIHTAYQILNLIFTVNSVTYCLFKY